MWNFFALEPLISIYNSNSNSNSNNNSNSNSNTDSKSNSDDVSGWIIPMIHGYFKQQIMRLIDDHTVSYTLIGIITIIMIIILIIVVLLS